MVLFLWLLLIAIILLLIAAYLTNPFNRFSIVRINFRARIQQKILTTINQNYRLKVSQKPWYKAFAVLKNGVHILSSRYIKSPRSRAQNVPDIIADIRKLRFNPDKLLLTSGDHFSALFVRNLGVFYYPTLDASIADSVDDWHKRQLVYIQTLAYALGVFHKSKKLTTTIVPTGRSRATCVNFYAYPSDTLYGMLFALAALLGHESGRVETYKSSHHELDSIVPAKLLLDEYSETLKRLYRDYRLAVFDEKTGLIDPVIHLSGAKDITRRESAFYDNVVFWKTSQLAQTLGLTEKDEAFLESLKQRIVKTFWLEKEGYFLEDLSQEGKAKKYYSSDWLIVLATGFLRPSEKTEQKYYERSIAYIQAKKIDRPFALKYQHETRAHRQFLAVRLAVASYGGDAIWSFWGMEYIKSLLLLHKHTGNKDYLDTADYHIKKYKEKMLEYGGFPEVYDAKGNLLQTFAYRSIRQTGWVIGFEQVLAMRQKIT